MAKRKRGPDQVKLKDWVTKAWLPVVRSQLKESTFVSYASNMRLHVLPRLGKVRLGEITPAMLTAMYAALLENGHFKDEHRGLSPKTVRYIHTIAHKSLADAVDEGILKSNPAQRAKAPKPGRSGSHELRFWDPDQLACFLRYVRGTPSEAVFHLAAFTGMRRGELCGLRWSDIDFALLRLSVRRSVVSVDYRMVETTPKSHQARVIDLDERTVRVLEAHRAACERAARSEGRVSLSTDRVFCGAGGGVLHPETVTRQFRAALRRAGLPRIRLHGLRHTHATLAMRAASLRR